MATVRRTEGTYDDADGVTIFYSRWSLKSPRAVVQISHGQGDHRGRYDRLARFLAERGFVVYADDHRGHGDTWREQWKGDPAQLGHPGVGGVKGMVASIAELTRIARHENPGLPVVFLGHSMGSLLGQKALDAGTLGADLVVWSGTALRTPWTMNGGNLNARHRTEGGSGHEWLNRDTRKQEHFRDDPMTFIANVIAQFGLTGALSLLGTPRKTTRPIPILILQGGDDALGSERSVAALAERYVSRGYDDVTLIVYAGARHEVYNEINSDDVDADLVGWINERLKERTA